ncbi:hypothetical protein MRB53_041993 [Persea americana]|nr:hypothetical protein MRB53_041993 [Persea americana]
MTVKPNAPLGSARATPLKRSSSASGILRAAAISGLSAGSAGERSRTSRMRGAASPSRRRRWHCWSAASSLERWITELVPGSGRELPDLRRVDLHNSTPDNKSAVAAEVLRQSNSERLNQTNLSSYHAQEPPQSHATTAVSDLSATLPSLFLSAHRPSSISTLMLESPPVHSTRSSSTSTRAAGGCGRAAPRL